MQGPQILIDGLLQSRLTKGGGSSDECGDDDYDCQQQNYYGATTAEQYAGEWHPHHGHYIILKTVDNAADSVE